MSNKLRKYCQSFPCSNFAEPGSAYCKTHQPARAPKQADDFYLSPVWRRFRAWYIGRRPLCEQCLTEGRETPAVMVDHIIEIKDGGALTDESNAMSLCHKCHNAKTAAERAKRKNHQVGGGDNRPVKEMRAAEGEKQFTHEIY